MQTEFVVPTYNASAYPDEVEMNELPEFGAPLVPVRVEDCEGVRLILGATEDSPDIMVEKRPNGWAIFLHPVGKSDPSGFVYFLDDGRSFVRPECAFGPTPVIEFMETDGYLPEMDGPQKE